MFDYLSIGSTPADEPCAQLGSEGYEEKARIECIAFLHQLNRLWPEGFFKLKWFPHDFGSYCEVIAMFDPNAPPDNALTKAAFEAEANTPLKWDQAALEELARP